MMGIFVWHKSFPFFGKKFQNLEFLSIFLLTLMNCAPSFAQHEELRQLANALYSAVSDSYDRKLYNLATRDHGKIRQTNPETIEMLLTTLSKSDETGRKMRAYITLYAYSDRDECRSASDFWFKHFIKGNSIKPNKKTTVKNTEHHYFVLFNAEYILIVDIPCFELDQQAWKSLKKNVLKIFEEPLTSALEINCKGEAVWSLNAY